MVKAKEISVPPARVAALDALRRSLDKGQDLQAALDAVLRESALKAKDAALATTLVYVTARLALRLDFLLATHLKAPEKLPPELYAALRLAACELLFLSGVPDYVAVGWCVDFARARFGEALARVANGVLRSLQRLGPDVHGEALYAKGAASPAQAQARYFSCPEWIVERLLAVRDEATVRAVLAASVVEPPLGLRANLWRDGAAQALTRLRELPEVVWHGPAGAALAPGARPKLPQLAQWQQQGIISRQSGAAQEALSALAPLSWPTPVWDACCGRGGKSLLLRALGVGPVLASDVNKARLRGLASDLVALNPGQISVLRASADGPAPFSAPPPAVLLDAPCTGLGVLSRRPDSKYKRTPDDVAKLAALQSRMLAARYAGLPPGGLIAYLTCTLLPEENEFQRDDLLAREPGAKLVAEFRTSPDSPLGEFFYGFVIRKN